MLSDALCVHMLAVDVLPPVVSDIVEHDVKGIGLWGGSCACPSGIVHQVGDNGDFCGSLACVGGESGTCRRSISNAWARRRVTCAHGPRSRVRLTRARGGPMLGVTGTAVHTNRPTWPDVICVQADALCFEVDVTRAEDEAFSNATVLRSCINATQALPVGEHALQLRMDLGSSASMDATPISTINFFAGFTPPASPAPPVPPPLPPPPPRPPHRPSIPGFPTIADMATDQDGLANLLDQFRVPLSSPGHASSQRIEPTTHTVGSRGGRWARSIAVVGSSGNLLYRGHGAEIDRHDVCRGTSSL